MTNRKSTTVFQRAIDGVPTLPLSPQRVAQKAIFCTGACVARSLGLYAVAELGPLLVCLAVMYGGVVGAMTTGSVMLPDRERIKAHNFRHPDKS